MHMDDIKNYSTQSQITSPGEYRQFFNNLSSDISELCKVVQGIMLHIHWAERYGVSVTKERGKEQGLREINKQLALLAKRTPTMSELPQSQRIFGTCRDFSTMLCSILRHQKIPSRPRCGFATYFGSNKCDHWVCEYWDSTSNNWRLVDAQLDDFQKEELGVTFDTTDIPKETFIIAGEAWQQCRNGANPNDFGIMDWYGLWFVKGNLIRDLLALSKQELLPWDTNEATGPYENQNVGSNEFPLLDKAAEISIRGSLSGTRDFIARNQRFSMPADWPT